jgi:hypothetical protein
MRQERVRGVFVARGRPPRASTHHVPTPPAHHPRPRADRKTLLRKAQADARREIDEYRAAREAKLRAVQPEAAALEAKVARVTAETCVLTDPCSARACAHWGRLIFLLLSSPSLSLTHTRTPCTRARDCAVTVRSRRSTQSTARTRRRCSNSRFKW